MSGLFRWRAAVWVSALFVAVPWAVAQEDPHVGYVYPAGARAGTELEVTLGGQYLQGVSGASITGDGVQAMVVNYSKPMSPQQLAALRRKRAEQRKRREAAVEEAGKQKTPSRPTSLIDTFSKKPNNLDADALDDLRQLQANAKKQPNPQIAETVTLLVKIARDAEPGERELRLQTPSGMSNPLYFHVGQWQEYLEAEPNDKKAQPNIPEWMPAVLNGQIMPGDVDRFRFRAAKGSRVVAAVSARSLIPYLADAVPGWFQATLTLYDAKGNQLAYADDFRFDPDPVISFQAPETGDYILQIKDAIYRGREDFVYRIALGGLPFVTEVFPLGGPAGASTTVQLDGWNLASHSLTLDARGKGPGIIPLAIVRGGRITNRVTFALDTLPECLEAEPNNDSHAAQEIRLPTIVNGRIDQPGDWDAFRFTAHAGDQIVAEVQARRLGSPLDSLLKLTDADGRMLAANDDHEDKGAGLTTHQADSLLSIKLPKDGTYLLHLGDTQRKGGRAYAYRLRVGPRQPDFELRVVPCSLNAGAGMNVPITVHALRKDGFAGDIELALIGQPPGFSLSGAWIPAGQDSMQMTLAVPRSPGRKLYRLGLEGRGVIDGQQVRRTAVPAEDMMQAFIYRHLVPAESWMISISSQGGGSALRPIGPEPVTIPAGGTGQVRVRLPQRLPVGEIRIELSDPPEGIAVKGLSPGPGGVVVLVSADGEKAAAGLKGNLIANAVRETPLKGRDGKPTGNTRRTPLGTLPAIRFEVVPARSTGSGPPRLRPRGSDPRGGPRRAAAPAPPATQPDDD